MSKDYRILERLSDLWGPRFGPLQWKARSLAEVTIVSEGILHITFLDYVQEWQTPPIAGVWPEMFLRTVPRRTMERYDLNSAEDREALERLLEEAERHKAAS